MLDIINMKPPRFCFNLLSDKIFEKGIFKSLSKNIMNIIWSKN